MPRKTKANTGVPYEVAVEAYFKRRFPGCKVTRDCAVPGIYGCEQIDVLVEVPIPHGLPLRIGIEAKDRGRRLSKDDFGGIFAKFQSARINRGIVVCARGVQSGFLERVRTVPIEIEIEVLTYEQLVQWADKFLDAIPDLARAKTDQSPTEDLIGNVIRAIETHDHYARYFFFNLENLTWIRILSQRGIFARAASGENQLPQVLVANYLALGAISYPQEFLRFCRSLTSSHFWAVRPLVIAASNLCDADRAEFFDIVMEWHYWFKVAVRESSDLIEREVLAGRAERALVALEKVTVLTVDRHVYLDKYEELNLVAVIEDDEFLDLFENLLPRLTHHAPSFFLPFVRVKLREAVSALNPLDHEIPRWKVNHVRHPDLLHRERLLEALLSSYLKCLSVASEKDLAYSIMHMRDVLADSSDLTSKRCVLFAASEKESIRQELCERVIADRSIWIESLLNPELESFIEASWTQLTSNQQTAVIEAVIESGHLKLDDKSSDDDSLWLLEDAVQWLALLLELPMPDDLRSLAQASFVCWTEKTGVRTRDERSPRGSLMKGRDDVREAAKNFPSLSVRQILEFCFGFSPCGDFPDEKTPHGISRMLQKELESRPNEFIEAAPQVCKLQYPTYAAAIMYGLSASLPSNPELSVTAISEVARHFLITGFASDGATVLGAGRHDDVLFAVARFIRNVCDQLDRILSCDEFSALTDLSVTLTDDQGVANACAIESDSNSFMFDPLNTLDGTVGLALGAMASRALRQLQMDDERFPKAVGRTIYEQLKSSMVRFLADSRSPRVFNALGRGFSVIWQLDQQFALEFASKLFDWSNPLRWVAAWAGYLSGWRSADGLVIMRKHYNHSFDVLLDEARWPEWGLAVARDISTLWLTGDLKDDDPLISRLLASSEQALSTACWQIGRFTVDNPGEDARNTWLRSITLWEMILAAALSRGIQVVEVILWTKDAPETITARDLEKIIVSCARCRDHHKYYLWSFLAARAESEPNSVSRSMLALSSCANGIDTGPEVQSIISIIRTINKVGDSSARANARECIDNLMRQSVFSLEILIDELNDANH